MNEVSENVEVAQGYSNHERKLGSQRNWVIFFLTLLVGTGGIAPLLELGRAEGLWVSPHAKFFAPFDGGYVSERTTVKGKIENVSRGHRLVLLVYSLHQQLYYPWEVATFTDGSWEARDVRFGLEGDVGASFSLVLLRVPIEVASALLNNNTDGFALLPETSEEMKRITVKRK